jgi:hypothetical protein
VRFVNRRCAASVDDILLLLDVKAAVYARLSDEYLYGAARLGEIIKRSQPLPPRRGRDQEGGLTLPAASLRQSASYRKNIARHD